MHYRKKYGHETRLPIDSLTIPILWFERLKPSVDVFCLLVYPLVAVPVLIESPIAASLPLLVCPLAFRKCKLRGSQRISLFLPCQLFTDDLL